MLIPSDQILPASVTLKKPISSIFVGSKRGMLTITKCLESNRGISNDGGLWLCLCECGKTLERTGYGFTRNGVSCGCHRKGHKPGRGPARRTYRDATITAAYNMHKRSTKPRGMEPLSREVWETIVFRPCHYCGEIDVRNYVKGSVDKSMYMDPVELAKYDVKMNGVDRLDNLPYTEGVCVPACSMCNYLKQDYPVSKFIEQVHKISNFQLQKLDKVAVCAKNE